MLEEIKTRLVSTFDPKKIILFGSYAWGDPREASDLDLYIIMKSADPPHRRTVKVVDILWDLLEEQDMDILVVTPEELETQLHKGDPFVKEIIERGEILYERDNE